MYAHNSELSAHTVYFELGKLFELKYFYGQ